MNVRINMLIYVVYHYSRAKRASAEVVYNVYQVVYNVYQINMMFIESGIRKKLPPSDVIIHLLSAE